MPRRHLRTFTLWTVTGPLALALPVGCRAANTARETGVRGGTSIETVVERKPLLQLDRREGFDQLIRMNPEPYCVFPYPTWQADERNR